jgi:hypothetical protein
LAVAAARDPLGREELLKAQMIESRALVRSGEQQAGPGQEFVPMVRCVDLTLPQGGIPLREVGQQAFGLDPADLGGGRLARRFTGLARVHPIGDRLEPSQDRLALAGVAGIAAVQHAIDDTLVELVAVLRQAAALVVEHAHRGDQQRVFGQRR